MRSTRRIIIRIIVAVAVAVILSKLRLLGIMKVNALTANTTFSYTNGLISQDMIEFNFTTPFATNMKTGTLITNVTIGNTVVLNANQKMPILRQAIVYNGTSTNVCKIGSINNGSLTQFNSNFSETYNNQTQTYTLECEVTPNPRIEKVVLYFSGTMNIAYLSFGPNVSFRENDILLQNETCGPSKNLLPTSISNFTSNSTWSSLTGGNANTYTNGTKITLEAGTYTISFSDIQNVSDIQTFVGSTLYNRDATFTINSTTDIYIRVKATNQSNPVSLKSQIELGNTSSSWEPYGEICKSKQDVLIDEQKEQTKQQKETNDLLKDDNTSGASSEGSSFFNNFGGESHGISGIVTAPLRLLNSFTTAVCNPLRFNLPFVGNEVVLPCMRGIYESYFGVFFSLYQLITTGLISYAVSLNIYSKVKNMQNPYNDKIEVLNL